MLDDSARVPACGGSVLIVDDDDDLRDLLVELLSASGFHVRGARDGEDGLRQLRDAVPDVILLDVQMPRLDGPGMALRLFLADAGMDRIPIVLLSGNSDLAVVARTIGTSYFLTKPTNPTLLVQMLNRAVRERIPPRRAAP